MLSNFYPMFLIECTKKTVNLAFLFDGSESMTTEDFNKNKVFIKDIMNSLKNSSIKVIETFANLLRMLNTCLFNKFSLYNCHLYLFSLLQFSSLQTLEKSLPLLSTERGGLLNTLIKKCTWRIWPTHTRR